jgi:nicotinate phosphoribosyltransferase
LGGFDGTSNVYGGYLYGIPITGTHAHSWVMSFKDEKDIEGCRTLKGVDVLDKALEYRTQLEWDHTVLSELYSFVSYAVSFPTSFLALVDSYYSIQSGVKNFLLVTLVLDDLGFKPLGIRLDSGDLAKLSKEAR